MNTHYFGLTNSSSTYIESIVIPHFKRHHLILEKHSAFSQLHSSPDFILFDIEEMTPFIEIKAQYPKTPLFATGTQKSFKELLQLFSQGALQYYPQPIAADVLCLSLKNFMQILYAKEDVEQKILASPLIPYGEMNEKYEINLLPITESQWLVKHKRQTAIISQIEKRILEYLFFAKKIATHHEIAYAGWNNLDIRNNTITATIRNLKKTLATINAPCSIKNVYSYGYIMIPSP